MDDESEPRLSVQGANLGHGKRTRGPQRNHQEQAGEAEGQAKDATNPTAAKPAQYIGTFEFVTDLFTDRMEFGHAGDDGKSRDRDQ